MANRLFLVNIDLDQNQLITPVLDPRATAPTTPVLGQLYFNTATQERAMEYRTGAWHYIGETQITQSAVTATTLTLRNTTGAYTSDLVLNEATVSNAGLLGAADWSAIQTIPANFNIYVQWSATDLTTGGPGSSQAAWFLNGDNTTWVSASNVKTVSQLSIKNYVDAQVSGGTYYRGGYDVLNDVPALEGTPGGQSISVGDMWTATSNGTFYTKTLQTGDVLIAEVAGAATEADWTLIEKNLQNGVESTATGVTDGDITVWDGTSGQVIKDSGSSIGTGSSIGDTVTISTGFTGSGSTSGDNTGDEDQATETLLGIAEIATQAETDAGTDDLRIVTPLKLATYSGWTGVTRKYSVVIAGQNGILTTFSIPHGLGEKNVQVQVFNESTGDQVECRVSLDTTSNCTLEFNTAPTVGQYRVTVIG